MADVRLHLVAAGTGLGLILAALLWAVTPASLPGDAALAAAARQRLGMVLPSEVPRPAPARTEAAAPATAPPPAPRPEVLLYVPEGETATQVTQHLAAVGLVADVPAFIRRLQALGYTGRIQVGAYHLWRGMDEAELAEKLVHGP